jgi:hypothetical protein
MNTIITVITPRHLEVWLSNIKLICKQNTDLKNLQIMTVYQKGMQSEILELNKKMTLISTQPEYLFISNQEINGIPEIVRGSYEHAIGLITGLQNVNQKGNIYLLDPDFFIIKNNWLTNASIYLEKSDTRYAGAMYDPSDAKQWVDFPCLHFIYFRENNIKEIIENLIPDLDAKKSNERIEFYESIRTNLSNSGELGFRLRRKRLPKSIFLNIQNEFFIPFLVCLATLFKKKFKSKTLFLYRILISIGVKLLKLQQKKQGIFLVHGSTQRSKKLLRKLQNKIRPILNSKIAYRVLVLEQQARMNSHLSDFSWASGIELYFLENHLFAFHLRSAKNIYENLDVLDLEMILLK